MSRVARRCRWSRGPGDTTDGVVDPLQGVVGIASIVALILVLAVTVMDQAMRCRFNVSISFSDQNPESARTAGRPVE